jgi:hypothetical protein
MTTTPAQQLKDKGKMKIHLDEDGIACRELDSEDIDIERELFKRQTGMPPEEFLILWRADKIPHDGSSDALSYRAAFLERRDTSRDEVTATPARPTSSCDEVAYGGPPRLPTAEVLRLHAREIRRLADAAKLQEKWRRVGDAGMGFGSQGAPSLLVTIFGPDAEHFAAHSPQDAQIVALLCEALAEYREIRCTCGAYTAPEGVGGVCQSRKRELDAACDGIVNKLREV